MSDELSRSIEQLYFVFGKYGLHAPVKGYLIAPEDIARIQSKPLRALSDEDLCKYSCKAMTTWGDENDFRHFLPRLFELATRQFVSSGTEIDAPALFGKLLYGKWNQWPEVEQLALTDFMMEFWKVALSTDRKVEECLGCFSTAEVPLAPYLEYWISRIKTGGLGSLIELGDRTLGTLNRHPEHSDDVVQWLLSESTLKRLEEYAVANVGEVDSDRAMDLAGYLRALRP